MSDDYRVTPETDGVVEKLLRVGQRKADANLETHVPKRWPQGSIPPGKLPPASQPEHTHGEYADAADLTDHLADTANPHEVTAAQIGAATDADFDAHVGTLANATDTDGHMQWEDKAKLDGVAVGATANDTDANLRARATHTGTQLAATISDFSAAADARVALHADDMATGPSTPGHMTGKDEAKLDGIDAANIAYEDEANTFVPAQNLSGGATFGHTTTTDVRVGALHIPRLPDFNHLIMLDYQDEFALLTSETGRSVAITPTPSSGTGANIFQDDINTIAYNAGTSPYPVVIEVDCLANPITLKSSGFWRIGLVVRSTGTPAVQPTTYDLELWDNTAGSYTTVVTGGTITFVGQLALFPQFVSLAGSSFNITKLKLTLNGTNPLAVGNILRVQRIILYHQTALWNPWHLHRLGGSIFGAVTMASTLAITGAVSLASTLAVTGKLTMSGAVAGVPRVLGGWVAETTPPSIVDHYGSITLIVDVDCTFVDVIGYAVTAPTGSAAIIDIEYKRGAGAWTTLYSSKPQFAAGANTISTGTKSVTSLNAGDLIRLNWDAVNAIAGVTIAMKLITR